MSEMVGRCVSAIHEDISENPYAYSHDGNFFRANFEKIVRLVLKTMRDPTEQMKRMGALTMPDYDPSMDDAERCWQSMIDEVLKEPPISQG